jgi:hypothetical protein
MSICTFAMRARRSSADIGIEFSVMAFNSAPDATGSQFLAAIATRGAPAALRRKTRLDVMVILFLIDGPNKCATGRVQGYFKRDTRGFGTVRFEAGA